MRFLPVFIATTFIFSSIASAQKPVIESISVCSANGRGGAGSCPPGTFDTAQSVLAPDGSGNAINSYAQLGIASDEHSTVFPPGTVQNSDYLFWLASGANGYPLGVVVLSGGTGPDQNGQWTFDFAKADGYGSFPAGFGPLFVPPTGQRCPAVPSGRAADQDETFDLSYAAAGSIVRDPTRGPGSLLMLYEACNSCEGVATATNPQSAGSYITIGVATSDDYGHSWPTYRANGSFAFVPLPSTNRDAGPNAGMGALGPAVCVGNDCSTVPRAPYGRYAVISPVTPLSTLMATGKPIGDILGMGESSAFLDDVGPDNNAPYVYSIHGYKTASVDPALPDGRNTDLMMARAQLNGGTAPLQFSKWDGQRFASAGMYGADVAILPDGAYSSCAALNQSRQQASINYVDDTQQYLLTFVCNSPTDPASGSGTGAVPKGAAWFWATSPTLSDPRQWSTPEEVAGSWSPFDTTGGCFDYKGMYPTLMSLGTRAGHLSKSGYAFFMWGCGGGGTPGGRRYTSRQFTISTRNVAAKVRAARH